MNFCACKLLIVTFTALVNFIMLFNLRYENKYRMQLRNTTCLKFQLMKVASVKSLFSIWAFNIMIFINLFKARGPGVNTI